MSEARSDGIGSIVPGHYGSAGRSVELFEATIAAAWNLQGNPAHTPFLAKVERLFDVSLPLVPNTTRRGVSHIALWLGPRSWLLVESELAGHTLALVDFDQRREALNAVGAALFEVSSSRVAYTLRGPNAAAVLARGCPLDFDPRVFRSGCCAQSMLGRIAALFYRHQSTPAISVMVARSLAADAWRGLCFAASTDGYDVQVPVPFDPA